MSYLVDYFQGLGSNIADLGPQMVAALTVLLIGVIAAWILGLIVALLCNRFGLDSSFAGQRLARLGAHVGLESAPSILLKRIVRWTIFLLAATQAALILELRAVADVIDRAVWIGPILAVMFVVLYVGAKFAERLARLAHAAAERDGSVPPEIVAAIVRVSILSAAIVLALEATGVSANMPVVVLAICLTAALGLVVIGLIIGMRGLLENLLAARYVEEQYIEGQMITFRSQKAQVRSIGLLATVVRTADGADHTTPNAIFLRDSF